VADLEVKCDRSWLIKPLSPYILSFTGKETRSALITLPAAFAAFKTKRPVRAVFDRNEDMEITGGRHPFLCKYKVGCTKEGRITGVDIQAYLNAGYSWDCSTVVMQNAYQNITNAYNFKNVRFESNGMKTFKNSSSSLS
jgi:xanthine dehydrogenase/oxidase